MAATGINDYAAELLRLARGEGDTVPEGFMTVKEWAGVFDRSDMQASRILKKLRSIGRIEEDTFRIPIGGRILPVPHYRDLHAQMLKETAGKRKPATGHPGRSKCP